MILWPNVQAGRFPTRLAQYTIAADNVRVGASDLGNALADSLMIVISLGHVNSPPVYISNLSLGIGCEELLMPIGCLTRFHRVTKKKPVIVSRG